MSIELPESAEFWGYGSGQLGCLYDYGPHVVWGSRRDAVRALLEPYAADHETPRLDYLRAARALLRGPRAGLCGVVLEVFPSSFEDYQAEHGEIDACVLHRGQLVLDLTGRPREYQRSAARGQAMLSGCVTLLAEGYPRETYVINREPPAAPPTLWVVTDPPATEATL